MKHYRVILLLILILLAKWGWESLSSPWGTQQVHYLPSAQDCYSGHGQVPWRYCIHTASQGTNGGITYLLHGRNLDEKTWNDDTYFTSLIQKAWATQKSKPPKIVTISFGPI